MKIERRYIITGIALLAVLMLAGSYWLMQHGHAQPQIVAAPDRGDEALQISAPQSSREIQVYVGGAVTAAGVYHLMEGDRVHQALALAVPLPSADLRYLGMARELVDGESILVPELQPGESGQSAGNSIQSSAGGKININRASSAELDAGLEGIGPGLAQQIVDYRNTNGPFKKVEDIRKVGGIGEKRFEAIKDNITVY